MKRNPNKTDLKYPIVKRIKLGEYDDNNTDLSIHIFPKYMINKFLGYLNISDNINALKSNKLFYNTINLYGLNVKNVKLTMSKENK